MWILLGILIYIVFWLTCIASYTVHYLTDTIQITSFSQVLYTLSAGTEGAEGTVGSAVAGFFQSYWLLLIIATVILGYYIYFCVQKRKAKRENRPFFTEARYGRVFGCSVAGTALILSAMFGSELHQGWEVLGIGEYIENVNRVSELYDEYFVEPGDVEIAFPAAKRNLIHIVVESLETTYTSEKNGGAYGEDLIPDLYKIAKAGTDFSPAGNQELNGAYVTNNSGWTVAGLVAASAGIPLNVGNDSFNRNFSGKDRFLPHVMTLGQILAHNGYQNYFMCGSDGAFAGRSNYYKQHGDYQILDYGAAVHEKAIPDGYRVWWGFEDAKLFDWAEKKLTQIAAQNKPFNFTVLTADMHFPDGYPCPNCENKYDSQYKNVVACTDRQIAQFIDWIGRQDFYKDTTIVISGDHLSMDGSVGKSAGETYERKAFTAVLNGPEYTQKGIRQFCTLDLFPTILESLGASIQGHRLGLGTSLYSETPTLVELMGLKALNAELSADSPYYAEVIMSGDESKLPEKKETEQTSQQDSESRSEEKEPVYQEVPTNNQVVAPIPPYYQEPEVKLENPDYVTPSVPQEEETYWTPPVVYEPAAPVVIPSAPAVSTPPAAEPSVPVVPEPVIPEPIVPEPVVPVEPEPVIEPVVPIIPIVPEPVQNEPVVSDPFPAEVPAAEQPAAPSLGSEPAAPAAEPAPADIIVEFSFL